MRLSCKWLSRHTTSFPKLILAKRSASILIVTFFIVDKIPPFHQPFSLQNYTLHYPFAEKERVPVFDLCLIAVAAPAAIIAFYTLVIDGLFSHNTPLPSNTRGIRRLTGRYRLKDRLWELNCGILGLGVSIGATFTITGMAVVYGVGS